MNLSSWQNWQNGGGPGLKTRLARLTAGSFEWRNAHLVVPAWAWIVMALLGTLVLPQPYAKFQWPLLERAVPIMWMLVAGMLVALSGVARASWPFAALIVWAGLRAGYHAFPLRSLQVMLLVLMGAFLYAAARDLSDQWARRIGWCWMVGIGFEAVLGALNSMSLYPWMGWISPEHVGKPMGMLTHPNYWGSFMALGLPLVWAYLGVPAVLVVCALLLKTVSGGPVIAGAVGALVMVWPLFSRPFRYLTAGGGIASIIAVMTLHEWRLSGRREVWGVAFPEIMRWPVMGEGLGQWRSWADDYNRALGKFFVTLQAHNEAIQLWFELGLVGLILVGLWAFQAFLAAKQVWRAAPAATLPGAPWQFGRAPLERAWVAMVAVAVVNSLGSPLFHLMPHAALVLFALARMQADAAALGPTIQIRDSKRARRRVYAEKGS